MDSMWIWSPKALVPLNDPNIPPSTPTSAVSDGRPSLEYSTKLEGILMDRRTPLFFFQEKLRQNTWDLLFEKNLLENDVVIFYLCKNELDLDSLKWFKIITIKSA